MKKIIVTVISLLASISASHAREWPNAFIRNSYNTYYIENKFVVKMPISIPMVNVEQGNAAYLSFVTSYVNPQIQGTNIPQYTPAIKCYIRGNIPFYEGWVYMIAVDSTTIKPCQ